MEIKKISTTAIVLTNEEKMTLRNAQQIVAEILDKIDNDFSWEGTLITDSIFWNKNEIDVTNSLLDNLAESALVKIDD